MRATIRPVTDGDGTYTVEVEFEVHPGEIQDADPHAVHAASQYCAGVARAMWLATAGDIETMAWTQVQTIPDDLHGLLDDPGAAS